MHAGWRSRSGWVDGTLAVSHPLELLAVLIPLTSLRFFISQLNFLTFLAALISLTSLRLVFFISQFNFFNFSCSTHPLVLINVFHFSIDPIKVFFSIDLIKVFYFSIDNWYFLISQLLFFNCCHLFPQVQLRTKKDGNIGAVAQAKIIIRCSSCKACFNCFFQLVSLFSDLL